MAGTGRMAGLGEHITALVRSHAAALAAAVFTVAQEVAAGAAGRGAPAGW